MGKTWLGQTHRGQKEFHEDPALPKDKQVSAACYAGSGYDRGHMCPAGDRSKSEEAMTETFLTSNIVPQTPGNNQGPWNDFENACRNLAHEGYELYIVSGGYGKRGVIGDRCQRPIIVPQATWKVVVALPSGSNDAARLEKEARVIALDMPNDDRVQKGQDWHKYVTTVSQIEQKTGYRFFSALPATLQSKLKSQNDSQMKELSHTKVYN